MKNNLFGIIKAVVFAVLIGFCISIFYPTGYAQQINVASGRIISTAQDSDSFDADDFQILDLINTERAKNGLSQLSWDDDLASIARDYSERMARENFFSHFDSNGQSVLERAKTAKLKHWSKIGENLFSCENVSRFDGFAVQNWMNSPTHRENILDDEWTATGVGIAKSESGEIFITQIFIKH
ncbi:MAG: CAP domain-containing protein [Acidobacteriota bacterium]|nr:CAP domain-containing protein [Acidobacteriota bacterium]